MASEIDDDDDNSTIFDDSTWDEDIGTAAAAIFCTVCLAQEAIGACGINGCEQAYCSDDCADYAWYTEAHHYAHSEARGGAAAEVMKPDTMRGHRHARGKKPGVRVLEAHRRGLSVPAYNAQLKRGK